MDILYIFNYEAQHLPDALGRLRYSIKSIAGQGARICVSNNSESCIRSAIHDLTDDLAYVYQPNHGPFSRAHGINFAVRSLVKSKYFMISDVDLIYRPTHLMAVQAKLERAKNKSNCPVRMVFWNYNLLPIYQPAWMNMRVIHRFAKKSPRMESSDYGVLSSLPKRGGFAHGNGIIHLESFIRLRGYDEEMIGYGPEDDLFNTRIAKVNDVIYDDGDDTTTIHLWHPNLRRIQVNKNMKIWKERKVFYENLQGSDWDAVMANKDKTSWGEI